VNASCRQNPVDTVAQCSGGSSQGHPAGDARRPARHLVRPREGADDVEGNGNDALLQMRSREAERAGVAQIADSDRLAQGALGPRAQGIPFPNSGVAWRCRAAAKATCWARGRIARVRGFVGERVHAGRRTPARQSWRRCGASSRVSARYGPRTPTLRHSRHPGTACGSSPLKPSPQECRAGFMTAACPRPRRPGGSPAWCSGRSPRSRSTSSRPSSTPACCRS
jgi:hypothetical protein